MVNIIGVGGFSRSASGCMGLGSFSRSAMKEGGTGKRMTGLILVLGFFLLSFFFIYEQGMMVSSFVRSWKRVYRCRGSL